MAAVIAGGVSGSSRPGLVALVLGMVAAAALAASRRALLWGVTIGGLAVTGLTQLYLPEVREVKFLVPAMALGLLAHGLGRWLAEPLPSRPGAAGGILFWMAVFVVIAATSSLVAGRPGTTVIGIKGYFLLWPLVPALWLARWEPTDLDGLLRLILALALVQLPFVAHQFLVLVPLRETLGPGIIPVDIIVGTFGGNLLGGGANAVLALFAFVVFAVLLGLWRRGVLPAMGALGLGLPIIAPVFINEAKVAVLYLPLAVLTIFWRDLVARPGRFAAAGLVTVLLFSLLMTAMTRFHPGDDLRGWSDLVDVTWAQQTADVTELRGQHSELTRWTVLTFWAQEHARAHPLHTLLGHGVGASRISEEGEWTVSRTLAEERYHRGMRIGYTAVSSILWDTGLLGLGAIAGLLAAAWRTAGRLAAAHAAVADSFHAGVFDGLRAAIALIALSLFHKEFFVLHLPYQTLVLLILGYLALSARRLSSS